MAKSIENCKSQNPDSKISRFQENLNQSIFDFAFFQNNLLNIQQNKKRLINFQSEEQNPFILLNISLF